MILFFQQKGSPAELPDAQAHGQGAPVGVPQARTATTPPASVEGLDPDLASVFACLNELHEGIAKLQPAITDDKQIKDAGANRDDAGTVPKEGAKPEFKQILDDLLELIADRPEVDSEAKKKEYGDVKYADPKNSSYPIDTEEHCRAAWSYINQSKNAGKYSASDLATIKGRIKSACKSHGIDISS